MRIVLYSYEPRNSEFVIFLYTERDSIDINCTISISGLHVKGYKCEFYYKSSFTDRSDYYFGSEAFDDVKTIDSFRHQKFNFSVTHNHSIFKSLTLEMHKIDVWYLNSTPFIEDYIKQYNSDGNVLNYLIHFHKTNSSLRFYKTLTNPAPRFDDISVPARSLNVDPKKIILIVLIICVIVSELIVFHLLKRWYLKRSEGKISMLLSEDDVFDNYN
ncbi:hypothetical protein RF11_08993 [Thelohanellus kitauei]|uniref:Uncharacterized protein n=1 Tax=Thelohanellus kitauei TaxID=669202 RepID=A0A0C2MMF3_THEKT|nr:hypothetical protein RF11_08993 [Thelohanellus kitauei]